MGVKGVMGVTGVVRGEGMVSERGPEVGKVKGVKGVKGVTGVMGMIRWGAGTMRGGDDGSKEWVD